MLKTILTLLMVGGVAAWGQTQDATSAGAAKPDRAAAYYYYALAHMYAERAVASGGSNAEYVNKAVENFKAALKADPSTPVTEDELNGIFKVRVVPLHWPPPPPKLQ
jgi:hypothetical protein